MSRPSPEPPSPPPAPPTGKWDWGTLALTSVAGSAVVGVVLLRLTESATIGIIAGLLGGAVIGLLTGYRPLHPEDGIDPV